VYFISALDNEAIEFINEYIEKPPKSFKNISDRPNKIYLYCFDCEKTFDLKNNV